MVTKKAREGASSRMKTTYTTYTTNTTNARNARNAIGAVARLARKRHEPLHGRCGDEKPDRHGSRGGVPASRVVGDVGGW